MILLCSRCGKVVILNVFKTGINVVSLSPVFEAVFLVFLTAQWLLRHMGAPWASPESSITACIGERELARFLCKCHYPRSHFTKLLTRALLFGPFHCSYTFVACLAFRIHVAGDLNNRISLVVGVLTTSFAHALHGTGSSIRVRAVLCR